MKKMRGTLCLRTFRWPGQKRNVMRRSGTEAALWGALEISSALNRESCQSQWFAPPQSLVVLWVHHVSLLILGLDLDRKHWTWLQKRQQLASWEISNVLNLAHMPQYFTWYSQFWTRDIKTYSFLLPPKYINKTHSQRNRLIISRI